MEEQQALTGDKIRQLLQLGLSEPDSWEADTSQASVFIADFCPLCKKRLSEEITSIRPEPSPEECGSMFEVAPGKLLKHFRILYLLGKGGMGLVYKAFDVSLHREVAIKILLPKFSRNVDFKKRLRREAMTVATLSHPHIVQIYSIEELGDANYIVMEYVQGRTLDKVFDDPTRIDYDRLKRYVLAIVDALQFASQKGITHRDIKPSNVMVDIHDNVKLMDFGLALRLEDTSRRERLAGTPHYMAPEQAKNGTVDFRSDIYSLGATIYHILSGKPMFEGNTTNVLDRQIHQAPPDLTKINQSVPLDMLQVIQKMLAKDPDERFKGYASLREGILRLKVIKKLASPGRRLLATAIDSFVFVVFGGVAKYLVFKDELLPQYVTQSLIQYFFLVWFWIYSSFNYYKGGQTFGMQLAKIQLVNHYGLEVRLEQAILRFFCCYFFVFLLIFYSMVYGPSFVYLPFVGDWMDYIHGYGRFLHNSPQYKTACVFLAAIAINILGYCTCFFDKRRRTLHDILTGTMVIAERK